MARFVTTAKGAKLDISSLKLKNEKTLAVGNAKVNARGDKVKNGKIVKTRPEIVADQYRLHSNIPTNKPVTNNVEENNQEPHNKKTKKSK